MTETVSSGGFSMQGFAISQAALTTIAGELAVPPLKRSNLFEVRSTTRLVYADYLDL